MARGVEGDLTPAERRALARHLDGCQRCGEFSESLRRTIALCREAGAPEMSARARARARGNVAKLLSRTATKTITTRRKITKSTR